MATPEEEIYKKTGERMAELGANAAQNAAERKLRHEIKSRLPKFLHPLIPGERGTVEGNLEKMATRKASNLLWSIGCTVAFFAVFGAAVLGMGGIVLYAFWSSGQL